MSNDITYFIVNPNELFSYLKNDFNTNSKMIRKYLDNNLDEIFIEKLLKILKL